MEWVKILVSALAAVLFVPGDVLAVPALFSFVFLLPLLCILRCWLHYDTFHRR